MDVHAATRCRRDELVGQDAPKGGDADDIGVGALDRGEGLVVHSPSLEHGKPKLDGAGLHG